MLSAVVMREEYPPKVEPVNATIRRLPTDGGDDDNAAMPIADKPFHEIGTRLERLRIAMGVPSQVAWARRHGFNQTQLNNWISGARRIPVEHAEALCDAYGVDLDWIYRGRLSGLSENLRNTL